MYKILEKHPELQRFEGDINMRMDRYFAKREQILRGCDSLKDFANAHKWFGFHRKDGGWIYREWAPAADRLYLTGDFNGWRRTEHPLTKTDNGCWEIFLPGETLRAGSNVMTVVENNGCLTLHIPVYARRVTQDWVTRSWCCEVRDDREYPWTDAGFENGEPPLIYEAHVGMSSEDYRIATY
ncbi:MAG: 1,4-alpha-glucan-branching enzyme, partial [Clostridia bacterium]|nr:1,4-alpha-glucan-branching enzyme [Clostridia bacterium]